MSAAQEREGIGDRSLTGLFSRLAGLAAQLARTEIRLAKAEATEKLGEAAGGLALLTAGGLVAYAGLLFLLGAAALALAEAVEPWLAALIVGAVVAAIGGGMVWTGRVRLRARNLKPVRTIGALREDREWAESQLGR
jgi:hypothetical protein